MHDEKQGENTKESMNQTIRIETFVVSYVLNVQLNPATTTNESPTYLAEKEFTLPLKKFGLESGAGQRVGLTCYNNSRTFSFFFQIFRRILADGTKNWLGRKGKTLVFVIQDAVKPDIFWYAFLELTETKSQGQVIDMVRFLESQKLNSKLLEKNS